jgi:N-acetylmuramoyl-L-alanine amidase
LRICIDAGHNYDGYDTGAVGNGLKEQDVTYKIADALKGLLIKNGFEVVMTRENLTDNVGKSLKESINQRAEIANKNNCDLFISIHCNSHTNKGANGTETLICGLGGNAEKLADMVNKKLVSYLKTFDRGVRVRPDIGVLRLTNMPAILVETAFISNQKDAELLKNKKDEVAKAIFEGVKEFLGILTKEISEPEKIVEKLAGMIEITEKEKAVEAIAKAKAENSSLYWILYKIVN